MKPYPIFLTATSTPTKRSWHIDILVCPNTIIIQFSAKSCSPVRITFVIRLFEMRKAFRLIKRCRYPLSTTVKICWTDAVLANLSLFSVALASGVHPDGLGAPTTNSVKFQQWHNYFLAAAQLPGESIYACRVIITRYSESWSHTFSIITSQRSSPAAKKLAVHLLHAVYVLGSRLNNYDPWLSHRYRSDNMRIY